MRSVKIEIGGQSWEMPASYGAAQQMIRDVGDPLEMAIKSANGQLSMSMDMVIDVIAVGLNQAGCSWDRDTIGEHVVEEGVVSYVHTVSEYIGALVSGSSRKPASKGASKKKQEAGKT